MARPMWIGALLFGLAGLLITARLRPGPRDIARALATANPDTRQSSGTSCPPREILRLAAARLALVAMVFSQIVLLLIMSATSLHMRHHQYSLDDLGTVIMAHTVGMFGLSVMTGRLAEVYQPFTVAESDATVAEAVEMCRSTLTS